MNDVQKAEFLRLADETLAYLEDLRAGVRNQLIARFGEDIFTPFGFIIDSYTGIPQAAKESWRLAGISIATLSEMATQVPFGGPPHGTPEQWVGVFVAYAEDTEQMLRTAGLGLQRQAPFTIIMDSWGRFSSGVADVAGSLPGLTSNLAVIVGGAALLYFLATQGRSKS